MIVIGLTGSIGMGKSAVAAMLRARNVPVFDADAEVHNLYRGAAVTPVEAQFPGTTSAEGVDRGKLAERLMADPGGFKRLEAIVHPLVRASERRFLLDAKTNGHWLAVLEIPLLFETGGDKTVDATIVVSAPHALQRERVLARNGMSEDKLLQILSRQWPDERKRAAASYVVDTGGSLADTEAQIEIILAKLKAAAPTADAFERYWA